MTLLIDLDGVIATEEKTFERALARPMPGARETMVALAEAGHTIIVYTARTWSEFKMTESWLKENGIVYHGLHMGKPVADWHIDDRAIEFRDWTGILARLETPTPKIAGGLIDESLLYALRKATKSFIESIARRTDLMDPILEVGPMTSGGALNSPVFQRMPDTFVDSRSLFVSGGHSYRSLDVDPASNPDVVGDFACADDYFGHGSIGTVVLLSCLEHMPKFWNVPKILQTILKPGGRAFILTPWNLRFHGPRPDCWRISDDGYRALFADGFEIESLEQIPCPGRPLSPIGLTCVVHRH